MSTETQEITMILCGVIYHFRAKSLCMQFVFHPILSCCLSLSYTNHSRLPLSKFDTAEIQFDLVYNPTCRYNLSTLAESPPCINAIILQ